MVAKDEEEERMNEYFRDLRIRSQCLQDRKEPGETYKSRSYRATPPPPEFFPPKRQFITECDESTLCSNEQPSTEYLRDLQLITNECGRLNVKQTYDEID